jgi:dienelactone hydrolase
VLIANLACFLVSHQAYSGDPSSVTIVGFCLGVLLSLPQRLGTAAIHRE